MRDNPDFNQFHLQQPERDTGLRYSLAYESVESKDRIIEHPGGKVRIVQYSNPGRFRLALRELLTNEHTILGTLLTEDEVDEQVFRVPTSARPLAYDASSRVEGIFSYSDDRLFHDLGRLLGKVATIDPHQRYVIHGSIGRMVAIVEFTHPGERQLQLVPGVEILLQPLHDSWDAESYYEEVLHDEFQQRFDPTKLDFRRGFIQSAEGGRHE